MKNDEFCRSYAYVDVSGVARNQCSWARIAMEEEISTEGFWYIQGGDRITRHSTQVVGEVGRSNDWQMDQPNLAYCAPFYAWMGIKIPKKWISYVLQSEFGLKRINSTCSCWDTVTELLGLKMVEIWWGLARRSEPIKNGLFLRSVACGLAQLHDWAVVTNTRAVPRGLIKSLKDGDYA